MVRQPGVLVVDDNADLLNTLALILKRKGYLVDTAEDGLVAVEKFKTHCFDVVLMDIVMPRMNGVEAFRRMRELNPGARIILMTAYYEEEQIKSALAEGAYRALNKPMDVPQLIHTVGEATADPTILIVDDDADFCRSLTRILETGGYRVYAVGTGEEAFSIAREIECKLAFVDVKLPSIDGLETCLGLKELNPELAVVMMTGYREEAHQRVEKALAGSAATCLYKPFDPAKAMELVCQLAK